MKRSEIYKKSIVLSGVPGSGKTTVANELAKLTGMPIVSTDDLRSLPHANELNENSPPHEIRLRKLLPNLPNYIDLGFRPEVQRNMESHGHIGWFFYHKQFETMLLEQLLEQLPCAAIIDLGGGVPISLDRDFAKLGAELENRNPTAFARDFNMKKIGFKKLQRIFKPFRNIVFLQLPENEPVFKEAREDENNRKMLSTGQYQKTATKTIVVENIKDNGKTNQKKLDNMVKKIIPKHSRELND